MNWPALPATELFRLGSFRAHGLVAHTAQNLVFQARDGGGHAVALHVPRMALQRDALYRRTWIEHMGWSGLSQDDWRGTGLMWRAAPWIGGWSLRRLRLRARTRGWTLPARVVLSILSDVGEQLDAVHRADRPHGRLTAEHVVLDHAGRAHVLGNPSPPPGTGARALELLGTEAIAQLSPEQAHGMDPGPASDVYALSMLAVTLLTCRIVHARGGTHETRCAVIDGLEPGALDGVPDEVAELIRPGLEVTPSARPTGALSPRFADALARAGGRIGVSETRQIAGRLFGDRTSGLVPLRTAAVGAELDEMILAIERAEGTGWSAPRLPAWLRRR